MNENLPTYAHTETTILGAMLLDFVAVQDATESLQVQDFAIDSHRKIYRAMLEVWQNGDPIDLITVTEELRREKELESVGGVAYLAFLTEGIPRNMSVGTYVRMVKDRSLLTQAANICGLTIARAKDASEDPRLIITDTEKQLQGALEGVYQEVSLEQQVQKELAVIHRQKAGEKKIFVTSGTDVIDETHGGFAIGEMTVIAARPSVGKSALLREAIRANCKQGHHCHLMTPEMSAGQVLRLLASVESGVPFRRLRHADRMTDVDISRVESAMQGIAHWPLTIDATSPLTPAEMISRARTVRRKKGTKLFGIDYLQKLKYGGKAESRHIYVTDAMVSLTSLAKNEDMAVVAISSLTEPGNKERNRVPSKSDLRQSGDIQYEANTIILLHREVDGESHRLVPECSFIFDKARSDEAGVRKGYFDEDHIQFITHQQFLDRQKP